LAGSTLAFSAAGGWYGNSLTAQKIVDGFEASGAHPGNRRNHAKGICVTGAFTPSPGASAFTTARAFSQKIVPVVGRFSISGSDPHGLDGKARVRGFGLLLKTDDGQEWRMALGNFPFFPVSSPEGFVAQAEASRPDPSTGKPDPVKMKAFVGKFPEITNFLKWATTAPFSSSLANTRFNGINAFGVVNAQGHERFVRWSLDPRTPFEALSPEQLQQSDSNFLEEDLLTRLSRGPLSWDMVFQFADDNDPIEDPARAWPETRTKASVGTLTLSSAAPQETGACRDINFDPLILPRGIVGTNDPILQARSSTYSVSFNRRQTEISQGKATDAIGKRDGSQ
jgi:catalase